MSNKAYCIRLRNKTDCEKLIDYLDKTEGLGILNTVVIPQKSILSFKKTDLIACITIDRGDLAESLKDLSGWTKAYFRRLEDLPSTWMSYTDDQLKDLLGQKTISKSDRQLYGGGYRLANVKDWKPKSKDWKAELLDYFRETD